MSAARASAPSRSTARKALIVPLVASIRSRNAVAHCTADVAPLAHPLDTQNVFRADEPKPSLTTEQALQSAPRHDGSCFLVPAV
ncbi:MAG: aspartyl/glutamyl-tRNA amidotransferase subunit C, partial [Planctomycetia bacterium]